MKKILTTLAVTVMGALSASDASAQCSRSGFSGGYGGFSNSYSSYRPSYSNRGSYGLGNYSYGRSVNRPYYHDTTHIHRTPSRLVPHRNHYDLIPGRNIVHRTGHWHH